MYLKQNSKTVLILKIVFIFVYRNYSKTITPKYNILHKESVNYLLITFQHMFDYIFYRKFFEMFSVFTDDWKK